MFSRKAEKKKKKHPYVGLAMFTLAAAGVINVTNKVKSFAKEKINSVTDFFRKKADMD